MTTERVRVGDVLRLQRIPVDPDPLTDYVSIGIRSFGKGIFHYEPVPGDKLGKLRFFGVEPDRLMVSNIKGWEGAVAVSTSDDGGCIASSRFLAYVPIDERIDVRWARWFFLSELGNELLQRASPGSADRNRTLAIDRFEALEISLPPIGEQQRLAARLDHVEAASGELRRKLDQATSLHSAFAASAVLRADLGTSTKEAAGWKRRALREVLTERIDLTPVEANRSYPLAGVYSFGRGLFERGELDGSATTYRALHRLHAGQVVMSRLKAWEGAIAAVPDEYDGWFLSPEFPTFDIDAELVDIEYLSVLVTSRAFWSELAGASRGIGARRERVHAERLLEQQADLPPLGTQREVALALAAVGDLGGRRMKMRGLIDALLPAAHNEAFAGLS